MKSRKVEWTDLAIKDLVQIREYISKDSINNANRVFEEIFKSAKDISLFPEQGRVIPKINKEFYREVFVGTYRVMYKVDSKTIFIVAVIHMAMDFKIDKFLTRDLN